MLINYPQAQMKNTTLEVANELTAMKNELKRLQEILADKEKQLVSAKLKVDLTCQNEKLKKKCPLKIIC